MNWLWWEVFSALRKQSRHEMRWGPRRPQQSAGAIRPRETLGILSFWHPDESLKPQSNWEHKELIPPSPSSESRDSDPSSLLPCVYRLPWNLSFANLYCPLVAFMFWTDCILTGIILAEIHLRFMRLVHRGKVPISVAKWPKRDTDSVFPAVPL